MVLEVFLMPPKKKVTKKAKKKVAKKKAAKQKVKKAKKKGRPPKYKAECVNQVTLMIALGARQEDVAKLFKITPNTLRKWQHKHPEFKDATQAGFDKINCEGIEASLIKSAMGYEYDETTRDKDTGTLLSLSLMEEVPTGKARKRILKALNLDENGFGISKIVTKHTPPNVAAAKYYLNNRSGGRWRDKIELDHGDLGQSLADIFALMNGSNEENN